MAISQLSSIANAIGAPAASGMPRTPASRPAAETNDVFQPSKADVEQAVEQMKRAVEPVARNLQFSIDSETGRTVVRVVDSATKEVIRQIPSEEILAIAHSLDQLKGLLLKQKA